jgi:peptidyl-prolyl cis-trans isomerase D
VITVGETVVTPNEFRLAYDRQIAVVSRQLGQRLTTEQARAFGIENQVYSQLDRRRPAGRAGTADEPWPFR